MKLLINIEISLNAPAIKVWEALTNSRWTKQYMYGYEVSSGWKTGDSILWKTTINGKQHIRKGKVLLAQPYEVLEISDFNPNSGLQDIDTKYQKVTYHLLSQDDKTTLLRVTDDCAGDEKRHTESNQFWNAVLPKLKEVIERK